MKIDYGPGWRIYYKKVGNEIVLLLTGGSKNGEQQDVEAAKKLAREIGWLQNPGRDPRHLRAVT